MKEVEVKEKEEIKKILRTYPNVQIQLQKILYHIYKKFGYFSKEALSEIALYLNLPEAYVFSVASFYPSRSQPKGIYHLELCKGSVCYVEGALRLEEELKKNLGIDIGGITKDLKFSLGHVYCLGYCALAPCMTISYYDNNKKQIQSKVETRLNTEKILNIINKLNK